jgi:hypothetical protein
MFGHDREDCGIKYPPKVHLGIFIIGLSVVLTAWGAAALLGHIWKAVAR